MTATFYVGQGKVDFPAHWGTMWIDGEILHLQFPAIEDIQVPGRSPLKIISHLVRFPADLRGITSAEMVLYLRRDMMKKEHEDLLIAFAEVGDDLASILRLYREIIT